ncbi:hypothetical protein M011DRAFT_122148 [Sporormia fimetaria CBS 119925]|uniref:Secreted protein n=1 Tax=Sporormia fimetaria CBS 119925 TaxID=1340428 RepID=A0A6A6V9I7_9PLEO|nr:hypothetical protein M011DRAFT_122148 [Sporormia fimetaria CBS 119925]
MTHRRPLAARLITIPASTALLCQPALGRYCKCGIACICLSRGLSLIRRPNTSPGSTLSPDLDPRGLGITPQSAHTSWPCSIGEGHHSAPFRHAAPRCLFLLDRCLGPDPSSFMCSDGAPSRDETCDEMEISYDSCRRNTWVRVPRTRRAKTSGLFRQMSALQVESHCMEPSH